MLLLLLLLPLIFHLYDSNQLYWLLLRSNSGVNVESCIASLAEDWVSSGQFTLMLKSSHRYVEDVCVYFLFKDPILVLLFRILGSLCSLWSIFIILDVRVIEVFLQIL